MKKLILLLILTMMFTGCMSTVTEKSDNSYRIETIEFPHSSQSDGFVYARTEWKRRAEELCKEKKFIGKPRYRNTNSGKTIQHSLATKDRTWIIAFGDVTCV